MSYAEHGSRIFLTGKFNSNPLLKYGEYVVSRKRSEGRLKLFDSCSDLRAWSPNVLDNCRHFRELVENRTPSGRIVPYDVLIESIISLGQTELASVRRQLERYKSLRLTPEQERQLRDVEYLNDDRIKTVDSTSLRETRIVEDESGVPKRPGTPTQSFSSSSSNFHDIEIDNDSSTDNNSEGSKEIYVSSETNEDTDSPNERTRNENDSAKRNRTFDNDDNQGIIIKKDSEIIALNHELAAKNADLEEMREICRNLESSLTAKGTMLNGLKRSLKATQEQLVVMSDQTHEEKEELKKKLYESKCLVEHLKSTLAEKSQKSSVHIREIQEFSERIKETETLRKERDSLGRKLDEMKIVMCERNDLLKLNKEQAISLADQEDEINRLVDFVNQTLAKYSEQEMRMKSELHVLRSELEAKNSTISQFSTHQVTVRTNISPTGSLSQVQTSEIRKFKQALREDLRAVEEELSKREETHKMDNYQYEEMSLRTKTTRDRKNETSQWENWKLDKYNELSKDLMECIIEQLTMQVSATNATNKEQDAIDEKIFENFAIDTRERIRRLVVELEPYHEERVSLIDEIKRLKETLDDAQRATESRDLEGQEYLSKIVNNHEGECEEYKKKIVILENLLSDLRNKYNDEINEEIDRTLVIHVKRSIEKITKLSHGLRGAGDEKLEIGREMKKIRDQAETKNAEIFKLREQVDFHVSRGQGDEANNERLKEILRLETEKKRLLEEANRTREKLEKTREKLEKTRDKLKGMNDEMQSYEFQIKGSKQRNNSLSAQLKQKEREIQGKNQDIERLTKENEGLNKTVLITHTLAVESDEMKIKLESLQDENLKLIEENTEISKRCENYENRLADFADKEIEAKEAHDRAESELYERLAKNERVIETLTSENEAFMKDYESNRLLIAKLTGDNQWLRKNNKVLDEMENVWTEIARLNEDRKRLDDNVTNLRYKWEDHHRTNSRLEEDLERQIRDNEILQNTIEKLNDSIKRITHEEMPEEAAKKLLHTLPNEICEHIESLRKQLTSSESEGPSWQREINEMRIKSREDDSTIEELQGEITLWKNKLAQQDKQIIALEEAKANLQEKLDVFQKMEISLKDKLQASSENETEKKDWEFLKHDIEIKNEELRELSDRVQSLENEKVEISNELTNERNLRQTTLRELQQNYNKQLKARHEQYNDNVKKLVAQQEESMKNTENPFDLATWLNTLTTKEMTELHKQICVGNPCEMIGEASKTRALNDKQNQQLQQDDILHTKNGHHKAPTIGFPYAYERRNFDSARHKPVETSFNDNILDTRRKNFFHQCAMKHKYDSH